MLQRLTIQMLRDTMISWSIDATMTRSESPTSFSRAEAGGNEQITSISI